ncbi:MAG: hypothetical protein LWW93_11880 [Hyphomicrobiales bacterium]|nr:hypothetical protein [Hyphomicrobiales bacterium]
MEISLAGLIGGFVGAVIGVMDFGMIAALLRRAWENKPAIGDQGLTRRREALLKVAFVVNLAVFVALGYWFGVSMTG